MKAGRAQYRVDTIELKKAAVECGLSKIKALSEASGIDRNTLSKVLSGEKLPSALTMYALVATLNLSEDKAGKIFFSQCLRIA